MNLNSPDDCGTLSPDQGDSLRVAQAVMSRALDIGEWERSQTHDSLLTFLQEEVVEFAEAVSAWSRDPKVGEKDLCAELSDLLLQVLFHAELAKRRGAFTLDDVADAFVAKMRSRAPYLFEPGTAVVPISEQDRLWAEGKAREKGLFDGA